MGTLLENFFVCLEIQFGVSLCVEVRSERIIEGFVRFFIQKIGAISFASASNGQLNNKSCVAFRTGTCALLERLYRPATTIWEKCPYSRMSFLHLKLEVPKILMDTNEADPENKCNFGVGSYQQFKS